MTAQIIDGKAVAKALRSRIAQGAEKLKADFGVTPGLATVLVGDDPASRIYVKNKGITARKLGFDSLQYDLPADTPQAELLSLVDDLNANDGVHGVLVQMPLPQQDEDAVINAIAPDKDVDGLTYVSGGRLLAGKAGLVPCTPQGSVLLIKSALGDDLSGKSAVVVGRSILVGRPLALLLLHENCTVTIAHSRTRDLNAVCRDADILCVATGRAEMVKGDWVKDGACVVDVGINRIDDPSAEKGYRVVGDVEFEAAREHAAFITPVPGGVGPMTIACLMRNTLLAAAKAAGAPPPSV